MNTKLILAALAGAVTLFLTGWLLYGMALKGFFDAQVLSSARGVMREQPDLLAVFGGCLAWSLLLALLYSRYATITTFRGGAITGAWIGFLIALGAGLFSYASMNVTEISAVLVDPFVNAVQMAVAGGVVGAVLGYDEKRTRKKRS